MNDTLGCAASGMTFTNESLRGPFLAVIGCPQCPNPCPAQTQSRLNVLHARGHEGVPNHCGWDWSFRFELRPTPCRSPSASYRLSYAHRWQDPPRCHAHDGKPWIHSTKRASLSSLLPSTLLTLPTSEWWPLDIQDNAITAASIGLVVRPACWLTVSPSYAPHPYLRGTQWTRCLFKRLNEVGQLG